MLLCYMDDLDFNICNKCGIKYFQKHRRSLCVLQHVVVE